MRSKHFEGIKVATKTTKKMPPKVKPINYVLTADSLMYMLKYVQERDYFVDNKYGNEALERLTDLYDHLMAHAGMQARNNRANMRDVFKESYRRAQ